MAGDVVAQSDAAASTPRGAELHLATYPTGGVQAVVRVFVPGGAGPHPVLILFHGFPGTDLNFDLAHAAMRAGWVVVVPHYRGSWGVSGDYSWEHALEDGAAVLDWVTDPRTASEFRIDRTHVVLAGHSLGGFIALQTTASHPGVLGVASLAGFNFGAFVANEVVRRGTGARALDEAIAATASVWESSAAVLHGTTGRALAQEAFDHGGDWNLVATAPAIHTRPVLLVSAREDDVAPPTIHAAPLEQALRAAGTSRVATKMLKGGHGFEDSRLELSRVLVEWLAVLGGTREGEGR